MTIDSLFIKANTAEFILFSIIHGAACIAFGVIGTRLHQKHVLYSSTKSSIKGLLNTNDDHGGYKNDKLIQMINTDDIAFDDVDGNEEKEEDDGMDPDEEEEEEKRKYCSKALWHPVCDEKNGCQCGTCHAFQCKHPFSKAHVIFVGDCSGSMTSTDNGKSEPQLNWIRNAKQDDSYGLVNRLGALYEAIYKFNEARSNSGCRDVCSVVMFETDAHIVARRQQADVNFVRNHILPWKIVWGCTSFYNAFSKARDLVDYTEETVMIFLTDGEDSDGGASKIVRDLKNSMKSKFSLYCITLAASTSSTVRAICTAGKGVEISDVTGIQLGSTFVNIAKKVGGGGFM
eukprot:204842_1